MSSPLPTPALVDAAAARLEGVARRTPLRRSDALSQIAGGDVWLKLETEQVTGSFKLRGALNVISSMPAEARARGVVAASAGNHGLGVAYVSRYFGIPATIFVPSTAPRVKKQGIAAFGATIDDSAPNYDAAHRLALEHARKTGGTYIDPCSGDALLAGQGTVALEIVQDVPSVATIVVPVGGGGLLGGIAGYVRELSPTTRIVGAQSVQTAAMARSLAANRVVEIPYTPTLADGLAGQIDDYGLEIGRRALDGIVTLDEEEIGEAIAWLSRSARVTAEGAGATAPGAILFRKIAQLATPAVAVVSGANIDPETHAELLRRAKG